LRNEAKVRELSESNILLNILKIENAGNLRIESCYFGEFVGSQKVWVEIGMIGGNAQRSPLILGVSTLSVG
jgi:hypothetical protein